MKKQNGITLVALVITIIVLLILAGVSISLVMGNNGVLTQASNAVITNKAADVKEKISTALASAETTWYTNWALNSATTRDKIYNLNGTNVQEATKGIAISKGTGYEAVVLTELQADGYDYVYISGSIVAAGTTIGIRSGSDVYLFQVGVDSSTGIATIASKIYYKSSTTNDDAKTNYSAASAWKSITLN